MKTPPLPPGSTIGIMGTGQLGRMLAAAAAKLGFKVIIYGPDKTPPAAQLANEHICASYEARDALELFAQKVDVATYEFENIPVSTVGLLIKYGASVRPGHEVLEVCQDRLFEKQFLQKLGLMTAPYWDVKSPHDLEIALKDMEGSGILKTRRMGYDGKGQVRLGQGDDPQTAFKACGGVPAILEEFVEFDCEISQIAMRGQGGEVSFFDPPHNLHKDGILHQSHVPANISLEVSEEARHLTASILEELDYIGVLTVEFFWSSRKGLMANEIAPRVHNSGHWTVEACVSSQFEQHIRAIAGWPLGSSARHSNAVMTNLIGEDVKGWSDLIKNPHIALTLYGKEEARQGRKMGHTVETSPL